MAREDYIGMNRGYDFVDHKWVGRDVKTGKSKLFLNSIKEIHRVEMEHL